MDGKEEEDPCGRFGRAKFFFVKGLPFHNEIFGIIRRRFPKVFEEKQGTRRKDKPLFVGEYVGRYIEDINLLNQMICESRPSEVKALESMTVEGYYSTVNTWLRIVEEKNEAVEKATGKASSKEKENIKRTMSATRKPI